MRAGELCIREVYVARPGDPLAEAAREMQRRHVGALVVVEPQGKAVKPIGIVTDRDILRGQLSHGCDLFCLTVGEVMSTDLTTVSEEDGLGEIIRRLAVAGVRRAPVVNASGELTGIVSFDDVLPAVADELGTLARLIGTQSCAEH